MAKISKKSTLNKITKTQAEDDVFASSFLEGQNKIKVLSKEYKDLTLQQAFAVYYGYETPGEVDRKEIIMTLPKTIKVGETYCGELDEVSPRYITFKLPGIKEEIVCKENFNDCLVNIQNYTLTHDNKLLFEVRQKVDNKYIVSISQAYYKKWQKSINKAIKDENGITVHIDTLVHGGFVCHTPINDLVELTGRNYTHTVFIPGSQIVLNIEHDFEQWIDQDVMIVPQKFTVFKENYKTGETENSLVGSRKRVLEIEGMVNIFNIYNDWYAHQALDNTGSDWVSESYPGTVTGVINSKNKTGVFVELTNLSITGLAEIDASDLLDYKPGTQVNVRIKKFDVKEGYDPFIVNKKTSKIVRANVRPVFEII